MEKLSIEDYLVGNILARVNKTHKRAFSLSFFRSPVWYIRIHSSLVLATDILQK